jgi:hypothetical protein
MSKLYDLFARLGENRARYQIDQLKRSDPELFELTARMTFSAKPAKFAESLNRLARVEAKIQ